MTELVIAMCVSSTEEDVRAVSIKQWLSFDKLLARPCLNVE